MSTQLTVVDGAERKGTEVSEFHPERTQFKVAILNAGIERATRIKDWEQLDRAVDAMIEEQRAFLAWWEANVTVNHGAGRGNKKSAERGSFFLGDAEHETGITHQQVSRWRGWLSKEADYRERLRGAAYRKAMAEATDVRGTFGTGDNEWYTPMQYITAAREVLGEIDLDPASSDKAQEAVRANSYFTPEIDGLSREWFGRVWLNPPYAQPHIADFVRTLVGEVSAGRVEAAILLTHNYTDTSWFHEAAGIADAICFTRGRIKFYDSNGDEAAPTQGQAFFYFGQDPDAFANRFASIGLVVAPMWGRAADGE